MNYHPFKHPKEVSWIACMRHLSNEVLTKCQDRVFTSFLCAISIISFRKLYLTSQTSNMCNILFPLYHAYFQQMTLQCLKQSRYVWSETSFVVSLVGWHGQKGPIKEGLSFHLSVGPIVCPSSRLSVSFLRIGSFFFLILVWC